jgi:hypothetical protein
MMNGEEIGVKHELCQIRVELTGVHPLIWRQLLVPSNIEERVACDVETDRAICMAGERACPPEDLVALPVMKTS